MRRMYDEKGVNNTAFKPIELPRAINLDNINTPGVYKVSQVIVFGEKYDGTLEVLGWDNHYFRQVFYTIDNKDPNPIFTRVRVNQTKPWKPWDKIAVLNFKDNVKYWPDIINLGIPTPLPNKQAWVENLADIDPSLHATIQTALTKGNHIVIYVDCKFTDEFSDTKRLKLEVNGNTEGYNGQANLAVINAYALIVYVQDADAIAFYNTGVLLDL